MGRVLIWAEFLEVELCRFLGSPCKRLTGLNKIYLEFSRKIECGKKSGDKKGWDHVVEMFGDSFKTLGQSERMNTILDSSLESNSGK